VGGIGREGQGRGGRKSGTVPSFWNISGCGWQKVILRGERISYCSMRISGIGRAGARRTDVAKGPTRRKFCVSNTFEHQGKALCSCCIKEWVSVVLTGV